MFPMLWLGMQVAAAAVSPSAGCGAVDIRPADAPPGGAGLLMVGCGTHGATLGSTSRYSVAWNSAASSLLVVRMRGAKAEALLVAPAQGGTGVAINNVTSVLEERAGRSHHLGLGFAAIDTTRFAVDGSVGVTISGEARWLDLKAYTFRTSQMTPASDTNN